MSKSEKTRQFIIEQTAPVFNQNGFAGTSLSTLQEVTGLTKGSLYGHFEDKEAMAAAAFQYSMSKVHAMVSDSLTGKETAKDKLVALLSFFSEYVFNPPVAGGCPLLNNAVEADDHHTTIKKVVSREIQRAIQFIVDLLEEGKKNKEFVRSVNALDTAYVFFSAIEGAIMISRVSSSDASMKAVVKHCTQILDQISK